MNQLLTSLRPMEFYADANGGTFCQSAGGPVSHIGRDAKGKGLALRLYQLFDRYFKDAVQSARELVGWHAGSTRETPEAVCHIVSIVANCAFGVKDCRDDYDFDGQWHPEQICCPMRSVCRYNGYVRDGEAPRGSICNPVFTLNISEPDKRLAHYLAHTALAPADIARRTGRSEKTIYNHSTIIYAAAGVSSRSELTNLLRDLRVA